MSDNNDHKEQRIGLWVAGSAAGLSVLAVLFYAVWGWEKGIIEGSPNYGKAEGQEKAAAVSSVPTVPLEKRLASIEIGTAAPGGSAAAIIPAEQAGQAAAPAQDAANVVVENGTVKFYFATGKSEVAANAGDALKEVLAGVKEGKKAVVSGYNDSTGNAAANEALSKQRAFAVRNALLGFGVPESQIELRKPADTEAGAGNNAEARRVEVVLE